MSAIKPLLEESEEKVESALTPAVLEGPPGALGFGGTADATKALEVSHAGLGMLSWTRAALEQWLHERTISVEYTKGGYKLVPDQAPPKDLVPWMQFTGEDPSGRVSLWGEASKMACPTFDLPAGGTFIGGACPGATAGQSAIPIESREQHLDPETGALLLKPPTRGVEGVRLRLLENAAHQPSRLSAAICQNCYASLGATYHYASTQLSELVHYHWVKQQLLAGNFEGLVDVFVDSIVHMPVDKWPCDARVKYGIRPVRVHSSGDFFSPEYAQMWLEVANQVGDWELEQPDRKGHDGLPSVRFWAPTRTWAAKGWSERWPELLSALRYDTFSVRPSAYHIGDPAPGSHVGPEVMGFATGSTSCFEREVAQASSHPRGSLKYDFNCPVYAEDIEKATCENAVGPELDGSKSVRSGCRACWLQRGLRVNYTFHK